ncbi:MAG: ParM/StbA family protein, partial [Bacillota bacterium]
MRVAVDLGYGFVKAVSENGKRVMFPSVVAPDPGGKELAEALGSKPDYAVTVEHGGRAARYLVGESAATVRNGVRAWEGDQTEHHNTAILYATAIALLNVGPGPVDLACGLPLTAYGSQRGGLASFLQ